MPAESGRMLMLGGAGGVRAHPADPSPTLCISRVEGMCVCVCVCVCMCVCQQASRVDQGVGRRRVRGKEIETQE